MNLEPDYSTARELDSSLSDALTLADGTLALIDDAAGRYDGDARYHALRALVALLRDEIADAAETYEAMADACRD